MNPEKIESLPEKEKRLAREIKTLPISTMEKVDLILVWRGLKPYTELTYIYKKWEIGDPEPDLSSNKKLNQVEEFNKLLGIIGLSAIASQEKRKEPSYETLPDKTEVAIPGKEYRNYCIAPNIELAEQLASGAIKNSPTEINEKIKTEIQKLNPELYAEMIRHQNSESK